MNQGHRNWTIELLNTNHDRSGFHFGITSLDNYIKKQARQDMNRRISQVFVATNLDHPEIILGYYTLSTLSIELNKWPKSIATKLPKHPIPTALIGRLAVRENEHSLGLGTMLLVDAIKRTLSVSKNIAIYAVVVDAIDTKVVKFYERFGFSQFSAKSSRLFLPLKSIG